MDTTNANNKNSRVVPVEVPLDDLSAWDVAAKAAGFSRAYWLRRLANEAAGLAEPPFVKRGRKPKVKVEQETVSIESAVVAPVEDEDLIPDPGDDVLLASDGVDNAADDEGIVLTDDEWEASVVNG